MQSSERQRPAFSIVEVLFAIMILGIGFILVAAMFPVAVQQTQASMDDIQGRLSANRGLYQAGTALRTALRTFDPAAKSNLQSTAPTAQPVAPTFAPVPPIFKRFDPTSTNASVKSLVFGLDGSRIDDQDPRYGFSMLYSFDSRYLNLIVVGVRATTAAELPYGAPGALETIDFVPCKVDFTSVPGAPTRVYIRHAVPATDPELLAQQAAVEGAVLVVYSANAAHRIPSSFYRLGAQLPESEDYWEWTWELAPGSPPGPTNASNADLKDVSAFILGRGLRDPQRPWNNTAGVNYNPREGASQVLSVRQMVIQ